MDHVVLGGNGGGDSKSQAGGSCSPLSEYTLRISNATAVELEAAILGVSIDHRSRILALLKHLDNEISPPPSAAQQPELRDRQEEKATAPGSGGCGICDAIGRKLKCMSLIIKGTCMYIDVIEELWFGEPGFQQAIVKGTVVTKTPFCAPVQASVGMAIPSPVIFTGLMPIYERMGSNPRFEVEFPGRAGQVATIINYDAFPTQMPIDVDIRGDSSKGWTIGIAPQPGQCPGPLFVEVVCPNGIGKLSNARPSTGRVHLTCAGGRDCGCKWNVRRLSSKATLHLRPASSRPQSLLLTFEIPQFAVSGAKLRFCRLPCQCVKYCRYLSKGRMTYDLSQMLLKE